MQGEIEVCGFRVGSGKKAAIVSVLSPPPENPQVNAIFPVLSFPPTQRNLNFHWPSELCSLHSDDSLGLAPLNLLNARGFFG